MGFQGFGYSWPDGYYCQTAGLTTPGTGSWAAGYYCPEGQTSSNPTAYLCPAGSACPAGSLIAKKCDVGYYQPSTGQTSCLNCPAGSYCDGTDSSTTAACPIGYYCPLNTRYSTEFPWPEGTYNDVTSLTQQSSWKNCPAGYYWDQKGQSSYSKQILAGYYSTATNQIVANPSDSAGVKGLWDAGYYCPTGSSSLTQCPVGTYNDARGSTSLSNCLNWPPGVYWNLVGKTYAQLQAAGSPSYGAWTAGYVCISGSTTSTPNDNVMGKICPVGYYCPAGTVSELECPTGTFSPTTG